jgi:type I restriction enzyme, S subunit
MLIDLNPKNDIADDALAGFMPMSFLGKDFLDIPKFEPCQWGEIKKSYTHFADGDVLLAKITPCFENGKAGIPSGLPNGVGAGSSEYFVCRTRSQVILPKYLLAYFKTPDFLQLGEAQMTGSVGHKRVPKNYLLDKQIPLAPLNEQKRIADKLDRLLAKVDACRERCDRIPLILKRFRQSVLAAATSGELTEDWREKHKLLSDWQPVTFGNIGEVSGGLSKTPKRSILEMRKPYLRVANVYANRLELDDVAEIGLSKAEYAKTKLTIGDLLIVEGNGSLDQIGRAAIWNGKIADCVHQNHIIRWRADGRTLPKFALFWLLSPLGRSALVDVASSTSGLHTLSISKISALSLMLPTLDEQQEIVRRVEKLFAFADRLESRYQTARAKCEQLTPALLEKAFQGELVLQDPNDEPASVLLERIKSLRTNAEARQTKPQRRKTAPSR